MTLVGLPPAVRGTLIYEARIARRHRILWFAVLPLVALALLIGFTSPTLTSGETVPSKISGWILSLALFGAFGVGIALADRFADVSGGNIELLDATPASLPVRMASSLAAAVGVALIPALAVTVMVGIAYTPQYLAALPVALAAFATILLPGTVLVSTFASACGALLPAPIARALVVVVWGWATLLSTNIIPVPTITGSVMSPLGDYVASAWFGGPAVWAGTLQPDVLHPGVSTVSTAANLATTLVAALVFFGIALGVVMRRR